MYRHIKELYFSIRQNIVYYVLNTTITALITIIILFSITVLLQLFVQNNAFVEIYKGQNMFYLRDTLIDADEFYKYREDENNINKLGDFYNHLSENDNLDFLAMNNQPIYKKEEIGLDSAIEYYDENQGTYQVKAFQLNKQAFDFYNLKISKGDAIQWDKINIDESKIPVLLSSDYENIYDLGDIIKGEYFFENVEFEVKGFLKENTFVHYGGNAEFYLDSYIIIPYPSACEKVIKLNSNDLYRKGIIYFEMINGNLISKYDEKGTNLLLENISLDTGFFHYNLLGNSRFSSDYKQFIKVLEADKESYIMLMIIMTLLSCVLQISINRRILINRYDHYRLSIEWGYNGRYKDNRYLILSISYIISFVFSAVFSLFILGDYFNKIIIILFSILISSMFYLIGCLQRKNGMH